MATKIIKVVLRGENQCNIRDHVHFGELVSPLTEPLEHSGIGGHLQVSFQRTHEWEAELVLNWLAVGAIAGGGAIAAGICAQFGAKIADLIWNWANNQVRQLRMDGKEIRSKEELLDALHFEVVASTDGVVERVFTITPK